MSRQIHTNETGHRIGTEARRDLIVIGLVSAAAYAAASYLDAFERLAAWAELHDSWQGDELIVVGVVLAIALAVFSARRWRELAREVPRRQVAEAELLEAKAELERRVETRTAELREANRRLEHELGERRAAEGALRRSEEQYRQLVEHATDIIYRTDPEGRFTYCNPVATRIMKYAEAELLGTHYLSLVRPDWRERVGEFYGSQFAEGVLDSYYEFPAVARDGSEVWIAQNVQTLLDGGGLVGFQAVARDITERRRAEEARREAEEYHNLFRHANDAILIFEPESEVVLDVNDKACEVYGRPREEFVGRSIKDFSQDVERGEAGLRELLDSGTYHEFETVQLRADGTPLHLHINAALIDFRGRPAVLSINRDITERKRMEEALRRSEESLRQSQKMEAIGTLAGGVAHDFNNLLTAIIGYSDLCLMRLGPGDPLRGNVEEIRKAAERSATLTRHLLAFSRRQRLERKSIGLNDLVGDLMRMLHRIIGEDVEVRLHAAPRLPAVFADPSQVEQVVMNLAVNGRDAMPGGGRLTIETRAVELDETYCRQRPYVQPGRYVQLVVSDTGVGMDAETRARIFEPFFTTKAPGRGTGLGLSTVYGIVKQHNGSIEVYSEVGQGTTFKVNLPVAEEQAAEVVERPAAPPRGGGEVVLLAEDEQSLRDLGRDILGRLGYTVLVAGNGEEALELFAAHRDQIDLVLLDMVMPRMGGLEAYERLRRLSPDVPVIFMTGYSVEMVQDRSPGRDSTFDLGDAVVIQKPYSLELFGSTVREALNSCGRGAANG